MLIGLVRHGKTDWNAKGIIQGQTDIPLNEEGKKQAEALSNRLHNEDAIWDAVISSDLSRARETAEMIANKLNIPLLAPDLRFRERYFGQIEGTTEEERLQRWGVDWRDQSLGMETDESTRKRGLEGIEDLKKLGSDQNILIVSHGSFIAQMLQQLCSNLDNCRLSNLSYSILESRDNTWHPLLHNCTKHLEYQVI